jgi:hypothetical protein
VYFRRASLYLGLCMASVERGGNGRPHCLSSTLRFMSVVLEIFPMISCTWSVLVSLAVTLDLFFYEVSGSYISRLSVILSEAIRLLFMYRLANARIVHWTDNRLSLSENLRICVLQSICRPHLMVGSICNWNNVGK